MNHNGIRCPNCGDEEMTVIESRMEQNGTRRRIRLCMKCGGRLTTHEYADRDMLTVREKRARNTIRKAREMLKRALDALTWDDATTDAEQKQNEREVIPCRHQNRSTPTT